MNSKLIDYVKILVLMGVASIFFLAPVNASSVAEKDSESAGTCMGMVLKAEELGVDIANLWQPGVKYAAKVYPRFQRLISEVNRCTNGKRDLHTFEKCLGNFPNTADRAFIKMANAAYVHAVKINQSGGQKLLIAETDFACSLALSRPSSR